MPAAIHKKQKSAIHAVPSACSRYSPVGSGALRSKTPTREDVLAEGVLMIDPPSEVEQQLMEGRLQEGEVHLAAQRLLGTG
jgi:hypothetical protein